MTQDVMRDPCCMCGRSYLSQRKLSEMAEPVKCPDSFSMSSGDVYQILIKLILNKSLWSVNYVIFKSKRDVLSSYF